MKTFLTRLRSVFYMGAGNKDVPPYLHADELIERMTEEQKEVVNRFVSLGLSDLIFLKLLNDVVDAWLASGMNNPKLREELYMLGVTSVSMSKFMQQIAAMIDANRVLSEQQKEREGEENVH